MKKILVTAAFLAAAMAAAQVGINNEAPKATLDVTAKTTDGTKPEGIIAPRLTGDQIKSGDTQYDTPQIGAIVYATAAVGGTPAGKTINITSPGYYYFDNNLVWQKLSGAAAGNFWDVTGNASTNPIGTVPTLMGATNNYVGTKDAQNLVLGVNGISRAIITTTGSFYGGAGAVDNGTLEAANTVTGIGSFVWGIGNSATGNLVSIFGRANSTTSSSTNIYGNSNIITGSNSINTFVTGNTNTVNNFQTSLVNGKNNIINYTAVAGPGVMGDGGNLVSGKENNLSGPTTPAGIVLGGFRNTVASSVSNMAIFGESNTVNSANTLVAGKGNTVNANMTNAAVVGTYNTPVDNSLFIVGNGVSGTTKNAVVVLNNGNVGIGTNAPQSALVIENNSAGDTYDDVNLVTYSNSDSPSFFIKRARGTKSTTANLQNNDYIGTIWAQPQFNGNFAGQGTGFLFRYKGDGTNNLSQIRFTTSGSVKMELSEKGNLGIGGIGNGFDPQAKLHVIPGSTELTPAIIEGVRDYIDNADATAAGLPVGSLYRTGDVLKIVH